MRPQAKSIAMPIFPLFAIGTAMLAIVLYFVAIQLFAPPVRGTRVYVPSAYGVSGETVVGLRASADRRVAGY
jgi:hypothetical protein